MRRLISTSTSCCPIHFCSLISLVRESACNGACFPISWSLLGFQIFIFSVVFAIEVECNLREIFNDRFYSCDTSSIFEKYTENSSVICNETTRFYGLQAFFEINTKSKTQFIPLNICVQYNKIVDINNFDRCVKARSVNIIGTQIHWILSN